MKREKGKGEEDMGGNQDKQNIENVPAPIQSQTTTPTQTQTPTPTTAPTQTQEVPKRGLKDWFLELDIFSMIFIVLAVLAALITTVGRIVMAFD